MAFIPRKTTYLDYASATPVRKEVRRVMEQFFSKDFYNPSAIYDGGLKVKQILEEARTSVARVLHAGSKDIIFTSGGTESDNLAILGTFEIAKNKFDRPHIIVTKFDHPAILEAAKEAERRGAELSIVTTEEITSNIKETTVLISLSLCNSETGEIMPVSTIGRKVRELRRQNNLPFPYLHIDASQAAATLPLNVDTLHADLLTLDAGKIYGPKGVGLLVVRPWVKLHPIVFGGGQERGLRSGTENISLIAGLKEALVLLNNEREEDEKRIYKIKNYFLKLLKEEIPSAIVNGGENTVSNIVSITLSDKLHEFMAISLADKGVFVSTGTSCSSRKNEEDKEAIRFSFGKKTREKDIEFAIRTLKKILI